MKYTQHIHFIYMETNFCCQFSYSCRQLLSFSFLYCDTFFLLTSVVFSNRHVGLLKIREKDFKLEKIPLKTVRPFVIDEVVLSDTSLDPSSEDQLTAFLKEKVKFVFNDLYSIMYIRLCVFITLYALVGIRWCVFDYVYSIMYIRWRIAFRIKSS